MIGEKWGPVVHIEQPSNNFHSLTHARLLVHTKAQNKIDARIRLLSDHVSCDVWVKEVVACDFKQLDITNMGKASNSIEPNDDMQTSESKDYVSNSHYK